MAETRDGRSRPDGSSRCVRVVLHVPVDRLYTYLVPYELDEAVQDGVAVEVPFGRRSVMGHVVGPADEVPDHVRPVLRVAHESGSIEPQTLKLLVWAAEYYCHPPGDAIRAGSLAEHPVRLRQRFRLTEKGSEALSKSLGPLSVQGLELDPKERAVAERLQVARGPLTSMVVCRDTGADREVINRLCRRGLAERVSETTRRAFLVRTEVQVRAARTLEPEDEERLLRRSPKMAAILHAVNEAPGPVRLSDLKGLDPGAAQRVKQLTAKGLVTLEHREVPRDPFARLPEVHEPEIVLNEDQVAVLDELGKALKTGTFRPFLLHGVTGSGKTELYLRLIESVHRQGRQALVLVPEIALTPQLAGRFAARFPGSVAVLHSGLTSAERLDQWRAIRQGRLRIVVGARSALFAPLGNLGIVVVDEEHDPSFKQQEGLRYHARDLALVRAQHAGVLAVLGTATPSLESYRNAETGRYGLVELPRRATPRALPVVEVVDMRRFLAAEGALTAPLLDGLSETLAKGQQAICFLNRRGFAPYLICRQCGSTVQCPHCSVSLTWHRKRELALCHYCGHARATPKKCEACSSPDPAPVGLGTERLVELLKERFPTARLARLDRDVTHFGHMSHVLEAVRKGEVDILVGTQMITKGHHFPGVTLVGVVLADHGLNFPDFRAAERTFQLLCQVAGRAGRGQQPGRVVVQSFNPQHHSIVCARTHDYLSFYRKELAFRAQLGYPPVGFLAAVRVNGKDGERVARTADALASRCRVLSGTGGSVSVLGPAEAPLGRLRGRTRWHVLLKSPSRKDLHEVVTALLEERGALVQPDVRLAVDVDPQDMM